MLPLRKTLKDLLFLARLILDASTLSKGYVTLPNGLKICWGVAKNVKNGQYITLPVTYTYGIGILNPTYNTYTTMRCQYSAGIEGDQLGISAYDLSTGTVSASSTLWVKYLAIGY